MVLAVLLLFDVYRLVKPELPFMCRIRSTVGSIYWLYKTMNVGCAASVQRFCCMEPRVRDVSHNERVHNLGVAMFDSSCVFDSICVFDLICVFIRYVCWQGV